MTTTQDASLGFALEGTYGTGVTPTRFLEFLDEGIDFKKTIKQGKGLRVGGRVARSPRRTVPVAEVAGDISLEATSKGLGLFWQWALGASTSALVSGSTYQQVHTLGDVLPSITLQKGVPQAGGVIDAYTATGVTCDTVEISFKNADILTVKAVIDGRDITTATAYAAPSYPAAPTLFHFANAAIYTGALTSPTNTALAVGATATANIRGGSITVKHNAKQDRYTFGGQGRKRIPTVGLREISGSLDVEYDSTTFRDAVLNETPMSLVVTYTGAALSTGLETLQLVLPEIKFDGELPKTNGTDLIIQNLKFAALDNQVAAQPIWIVCRTSDTAL